MNKQKNTREQLRLRRHRRIRAKVIGTAQRPRLSVFRSLRGMYAQLINDEAGTVVLGVHSKKDATATDVGERKGKVAKSYALGLAMGEKMKAANIAEVVFDRGGYAYHGRVQAFADGVRAAGIKV